jgi:uncharacterized membrane protein YgdD (TMEM256/DUF423 family)
VLKLFIILGSLNAFLCVVLGAFGAHGLKKKLSPEMLDIFQTGVQYHMYHAIGLILVGMLAQWLSPSTLGWAGWTFMIGIVFFSGSLYVLSISGIKWLGAITPLGGLAFLLGWLFIIIAAIRA